MGLATETFFENVISQLSFEEQASINQGGEQVFESEGRSQWQ